MSMARDSMNNTNEQNLAPQSLTSKINLLNRVKRSCKRGNMFYADLTVGVGSEQSGYRPVLIISNDIGNKHSGTVIAAVITSRTSSKANLPTHCFIKAELGLGRDSLVLLEQIRAIDKARLKDYIGTLNSAAMTDVDKALAVSLGLRYYSG